MSTNDLLVTLFPAASAGILVAWATQGLRRPSRRRSDRGHRYSPRLERKLERSLPDVLDRLASTMASGFGLHQAMESVAGTGGLPFSDVLSRVLAQVRSGQRLDEALEWASDLFPGRTIPLTLYAMASSHRRGTNLIESLQLIARVTREREVLRRKVSVMTAQGRLQGMVLCAVPFLFMVALLVVAPGDLIPVLKSAFGRWLIAFSLLLQGVGGYIISRMVRREFL
ncbi:MAG: type II secretion system F family protein [bacterium]|nr:MAG: type II secretion system F family protein [bacterium]